ncbi:MAG: tRNA (guanosine(37)-N1)-methyltransferase TrmD [Lachnospiraceae bacterium]|nr:tRNA (guanosine(37)-N1)-methyltransferase TrmD [Lachnospiraceae bacterium]
MRFHVMTLFPEMVMGGLNNSITKRAMEKGLIDVVATDIRDFTLDKNRRVDDYPYGGGAGLVMQAQPIFDCYQHVKRSIGCDHPVIYMSPQGQRFDQKKAEELSGYEDIVILCGHYEGVDERIIDSIVTEQISIGDFVLTGGELPAMMIIDCVSRLIPGVLNNDESAGDESFEGGLLEYPQYTRPEVFNGQRVPEVLLSGHHGKIAEWRRQKSLERTLMNRPDLLYEADLTEKDREYLGSIVSGNHNEN